MIVQILSKTPAWVFVLFVGLLVFGLMQARSRHVSMFAALLLPVGMIALSLAGIHSSFGLRPVPLASWAVALVLAVTVGYALFRDKKVAYDATTKKFFVPGSWTPLAVIMAIFFAKYAYAVMDAMKIRAVSAPLFVVVLSAVYGVLSGYFGARAVNLIRKARSA